MCDLIQSFEAVQDIHVMPGIFDVYRDLRGSSVEFICARPSNHIFQLG